MARLEEQAVQALADDRFGLDVAALPLPGELDENWKLSAGDDSFVLRLSHPRTTSDDLAIEIEALGVLGAADLDFAVPRVVADVDGAVVGEAPDGRALRLYTWVEGTAYGRMAPSEELDGSIGRAAAAMVDALQDLTAGERSDLTWDLAKASDFVTDRISVLADSFRRGIVERVARDVRENVEGIELPRSVIHNDLNDLNVLAADGAVTGVIDFGDMMRSYRAAEVAIAAAYAMLNRRDPMAAAERVVAGYATVASPTSEEAEALFDLIRARLAISVVESSGRLDSGNVHHQVSAAGAWDMLERLDAVDRGRCRARLAAAAGHDVVRHSNDLLARRQRHLGSSLSLSSPPMAMVFGRGTHLYDNGGRAYLDCVNNVAHVGHGHPHVVRAITNQAQRLNTNTRYLHERRLEYVERLAGLLPEALEVVYLVNSGSEATELAVRLARAATGRHEMAVLEHGYHGNTVTAIELSHYKFDGPGGAGRPGWVTVLPSADAYRGEATEPYGESIELALEGVAPAGVIAETLSGCGGQLVPPADSLRSVADAIRRRGGLLICDEVQTGFGRVGSHFWSFELSGLMPDIVTMGKPIGNGHPIGAVATTRAIAESFANGMEWFNTFGGNPVSAAAGMAVLDVLEDEELQPHADRVGARLIGALSDLASRHAAIGDVRGHGLFLGVDLVIDRDTKEPDPSLASHVLEQAVARGVLLSSDGPGRNVLKIKPPLPFADVDADRLVEVLDGALQSRSA